MEGKLSTEADDESSINPSRRRVLKASAALSATGVVGSGFVGSAAGKHRDCSSETQCRATVVFNQGTVNNCPSSTNAVDRVTVDRVELTCPNGGWVDLHDPTVRTGPSGTFKAGYPVGMSTVFQDRGTYTNVEICLFTNSEDVKDAGTCLVDWNRNEWPNDQNPSACRSMSAMAHLDDPSPGTITHYCNHVNPDVKHDHAYLCDRDGDGDLEPVQDFSVVCGDGTL